MEIIKIKNSTFEPDTLISSIASYIKSVQLDCGAIPWFTGYKLDPWDHSEAIMALNISGEQQRAHEAFLWLERNQNSDGSWYAKYLGDERDGDLDRYKVETNFVAYPATALWHAFLCSGDLSILDEFFPMVERAINYVVAQQNPEGDIQWALSDQESLPRDALVTASASVLRSLECAVNISETLDKYNCDWLMAHSRLSEALKNKPWRFDRSWESKARFSMDWFYPILSGVYSTDEAKLRIEQSKDRFIIEDYGCKCVSDEPWVTVAESCELVIALIAAGKKEEAFAIFHKLQRWQDSDGGFWTGYQYEDECIWPNEKTTWTAAAVALACDALFELSPASHLFTEPSGLFFSV